MRSRFVSRRLPSQTKASFGPHNYHWPKSRRLCVKIPSSRAYRMVEAVSQEITQLLLAWNEGDEKALDALIPLVHEELHRLAHRHMAAERAGHPLQTTA